MKRVYIAGSYNAPNIIQCLDNIRNGIKMATEVILAGYAPFCPWLDYQYRLINPYITREMFQEQGLAWVDAADAMLVMPNSEDSKGTQAEIARARELGIPVYYDFDQLKREVRSSHEDKYPLTDEG
jgi:hypothetical protein